MNSLPISASSSPSMPVWRDGADFDCKALQLGLRGQPVIVIGTRGAVLTKVVIRNETTKSYLCYDGIIEPGKLLILDCARECAEVDGVSVYGNLVTDPDSVVWDNDLGRLVPRWFRLESGKNAIVVEAYGSSADWWWAISAKGGDRYDSRWREERRLSPCR